MNIHIHRKLLILPIALVLVVLAAVGVWLVSQQPKTDIRTQSPGIENFSKGQITQGSNAGDAKTLKTTGTLAYESGIRQSESPTTNAIGIRWKQYGAKDGAELQVRVYSDSKWTDWVDVESDAKKDGTPSEDHAGLVLTSNAKAVQYRFVLNGNGQEVSIAKPELALIDSTRGPDPTKPKGLVKVFGKKAQAAADAPRIFSRGEWGCPQANSSPGWSPNYWNPLRRVIVHHTVTAGSTTDAAAEIRGIWQFHTYTNGWGDIGYNYLVDKLGNIYQGRFYNPSEAAQFGEVEGGHAYGFNDYSVGIATLGDFQNQGGTTAMVYGVARIAGWKMHRYNLLPWSQYSDEGVSPNNPDGGARGPKTQYAIAGHRDYLSTACPGNNMYVNLPNIRSIATSYEETYAKWDQYDYSYAGQGVNGSPSGSISLRPGQTTTAYVDLKNEGNQTWHSDGANPVRLGTSHPFDRPSGFRDSSWVSPNRVGSFSGKVSGGSVTPSTTIAPGETARFPFTVGNQGATSGTYDEYFQPVLEGATWFPRDIGLFFRMTSIGDVYSYQWVTQVNSVPTEPGQTATLSVDVKNTGNMDWHNDGANPVRLGTERPRDHASPLRHSSWVGNNRVGTFAGQVNGGVLDTGDDVIEPDETARFTFTAQAPTTPFVGNDYFNLVVEGKTWMNDIGMFWAVNTPQNYHVQWAGQSAAPTVDKSNGGIGSMYFDFKNTGTYPWRQGQIVRLGTANPLDRASRFFATGLSGGQLPANTANWTSANRTGSFAGQVNTGTLDAADTVIEPGATGRFMIAVDARNVDPGTYREYFRPVADGFAWLEDYGVFLDVTVTP